MRRPWEKPLDEGPSGVAIPDIRWCSGVSSDSVTVVIIKECNDNLVSTSHPEASNLTVQMSISVYALIVQSVVQEPAGSASPGGLIGRPLDLMCIHLPTYIHAHKHKPPAPRPHVTSPTIPATCSPKILNHNPPFGIASSDSNACSSLTGTAVYHSKVNTFSSMSPTLLGSTTKST